MNSKVDAGRENLRFKSGNEQCDAWLYRPAPAADGKPVPVIVMAHGLSAIKELALAPFAERFRQAGYACLVFDYRYFGASSGEPREWLDIPSQLADWKAAVAFARSLPGIDPARVILWGTSFGGGHVIITAADDQRVAAAIAQCPFTDGPASMAKIPLSTAIRIGALALRDEVASRLGWAPVRVNGVGKPGAAALMTAEDALTGYYALVHAAGLDSIPTWVPARIGLRIPLHRPGARTGDVRCPILFSVCDRDSVAPAKATLRHARRAPKGEVKRYDTGHFEIYLGEWFERNVKDQLAFLQRQVPV